MRGLKLSVQPYSSSTAYFSAELYQESRVLKQVLFTIL